MAEKTTRFSDYDIHLFSEGSHFRSYELLGAHPHTQGGTPGTAFAVWAPNARGVSVIGDFNHWDASKNYLHGVESTGIWEGFIPGVKAGDCYKYSIDSHARYVEAEKIDPYGFHFEAPPRTASVVCDISQHTWGDQAWMNTRGNRHKLDQPINIYELHLGSWRRTLEDGGKYLSYADLAEQLPPYLNDLGFTHVEFMPVTEHPFDGSWGYQTTGYFAPTSRFGTPEEFMKLVDALHQANIGVIIDWVPGHFPTDAHGLAKFDGSSLYEHEDLRKGFHPDWQTLIFNFGRREVANFLISSALFWMDKYHIDGLRVDAVASMLYLDYSREEGEWIPNEFGGRENLEAIAFLKRLNETVYYRYPDSLTIAEESTSWPMVSRPTYVGGLGFGLKWNMGWMNDVLEYFKKDPVYRTYHHNNLTFGLLYAFHENFMLPFSHDEVVHGKGSMLGKMPGDDWQKFANLRLLYGFMYGHPGKNLLFMGAEFAQWDEWCADKSLDWHLLEYEPHQGIQRWVRDLNQMVRTEGALHQLDFEHEGFRWVDCLDSAACVLSFLRFGDELAPPILCVCNFTPVPRDNYRVGVPADGYWEEVLNSDAEVYGGSGIGNLGGVLAESHSMHDLPFSLSLQLPPLSVCFFRLGGV